MKLFTWADLLRVIKAVYLDQVKDGEELKIALSVAFFIVAGLHQQIRGLSYDLETDFQLRHGTYAMLKNIQEELANSLRIFARSELEEDVRNLIEEIYESLGGTVRILDTEVK